MICSAHTPGKAANRRGLGATRLTALVVAAAAALTASASTPVVVYDGGDAEPPTAVAEIAGVPAIAYILSGTGTLMFTHALDASGDTWSAPVAVTPLSARTGGLSLAEVDGRPAIGFAATSTDSGLHYVIAQDASGSSWNSAVYIAPGGSEQTLRVVDGRPAFAFTSSVSHLDRHIAYVRALDSTGASWGSHQSLDTQHSSTGDGSLGLVGGSPAVAYIVGNSPWGVAYVRGLDAAGSSWSQPRTVVEGWGYSAPDLDEVAGHPAVTAQHQVDASVYDVVYSRATTASGTTWGPEQVLTRGISSTLRVVDGRPAVVFVAGGYFGPPSFLWSLDPTGTQWALPVTVTGHTGVHEVSFEVIGGGATVSYVDTGDVLFVRSDGTGFSDMAVVPSAHDFGEVDVGANADVIVELSHVEPQTVSVAATTIIGADAPAFAVVAGGAPFGLAAGEVHQLHVRFGPDAARPYQAALRIESDHPGSPVVEVPLAGTGSTPSNQGCAVRQLTHGSGDFPVHFMMSISDDGRRVAFASGVSPVPGGNPDGNREIFVWDETAGLIQVTDTSGGTGVSTNSDPRISPDGCCVVFRSSFDLVPPTNSDASFEVFSYDIDADVLTQLTDGVDVRFLDPALGEYGRRLVLLSDADTGHNPDQNLEVVSVEVASGQVTPVTETLGSGNWDPVPSGSGTAVVFESWHDHQTGSNLDGSREVFLQRDGVGIIQLSDTTGGDPTVDVDHWGEHAVVLSAGELVAGGNPDGNPEVYLWDVDAGLSQITSTQSPTTVAGPSIDDTGRRIAFVSNGDLVSGSNPDGGDEVFMWDSGDGRFHQLTDQDGSDLIVPAAVDISRTRAVFGSTADPVGQNPQRGFELFLVTCEMMIDGFESGDLRFWSGTVDEVVR